jgi:chromosomal replication initiator protein
MHKERVTSAYGVWRQLCRQARTHLSPTLYHACFAGTVGAELGADTLVVHVPSEQIRQQLEGPLSQLLAAMAQRLLHQPLHLRFLVPGSLPAPTRRPGPARGAQIIPAAAKVELAEKNSLLPTAFPVAQLNARYRFETFVVGESNRLAYAAAQSVAANPGATYNPLFIYGGVGLGKTHLLMAIGHVLAAQGRHVFYVTAETFANEMIDAIQHNAQEAFRAHYRAIDVLLVDDIQFIGGREQTEEEFFHTFNTLHTAGRHIVVTSDRVPRAIPTLHDRLRSRFEWGLLADITAPDYAHRLEILTLKARETNRAVPPMVLEYLARPEGSSVRQLEGALNRLLMSAHMHSGAITLALAAATMRECFGERGNIDLSPQIVMDLVANHYHVEVRDILGKGRTRTIAWPRQVVMYLLREETEQSLAQIGAAMGGRDHTTIMHGCEQVAASLLHDDHLKREIEVLRNTLRTL